MKKIITADPTNIIQFHKDKPIRPYDEVQQIRTRKTKELIQKTIDKIQLSGNNKIKILEVGCGVMYVTGEFSEKPHQHSLIGIECNKTLSDEAKALYPNATVINNEFDNVSAIKCNLLICCETLEHLVTPRFTLCKFARYCSDYMIISHPLNEAEDSNIAAGEHLWSYDLEDFEAWFSENNFVDVEYEIFKMGNYDIVLGVGRRNKNSNGFKA